VRGKPTESHTVTPHLVVRGPESALGFYRRAFRAEELYRNLAPDGKAVMPCEMFCPNSRFFINDKFPQHEILSPTGPGLRRSPVTLRLYVDHVDDLYERAAAAGAEVAHAAA
jgi:uncharacterized glyoxalase superfamily protein PhnB